MASSGLAYTVSEVDYVSAQRIQAYLEVPALAILIYDFCLTFDDEIQYIWKRTKTPSSYLYFLQRSLAVIGIIPSAASIISMPSYYNTNCGGGPPFNMMGNVTLVISEFLVGIYLFLRIYALYEKSRRILIMGVIASIISITILAVILAGKHQKGGLTGGGCDTGSAPSTSLKTAIAWGFVILNESVIFGLILYKIAENRRPSSLPTIRSFGSQLSLQELIVRDGVMYFLVVIFVNVANMASYFFPQPLLRGSVARLSCNIATVMITRLMLNLHQLAESGIMSSPSQISTLHCDLPPT